MDHIEMTETPAPVANGTSEDFHAPADANGVSEECHVQSNGRESMPSVWTVRHIIATCIASLGMLSIGAGTQGYITTAIPDLNSRNHAPFRMDTIDTLVFITMNSISAIISSVAVSWSMDRFGRKLNMMFGCVLITIGLVIIGAAYNIYMMHGGQFIAGLGAGISQPTIVVYIAEISPISIRGSLITCIETSYNAGLLFAFTVGAFVDWRWQAIACASIAVANICALIILPDSPQWLYMVRRREAGLESIKWFYKDDTDTAPIASEIDGNLNEPRAAISWKSFIKPPLIKLVVISQILFLIREFTGMNILRKFAVDIFEMTGSKLNPNVETILFGAASLFGAATCIIFVDRCRRKSLIITSCIILTICMAIIGTYFKLDHSGYTFVTEHMYWLPLSSLILATVGYNIGIGTLAYAVSAEMFPTVSRGKANGLAITGYNLWMTLSNWMFAKVLNGEHNSIAFWMFAIVSFIGIIFVYFAIPETKFQTLH